MSAEAVHCPDALASSPELREPDRGVPEIPAEFQGQASEEPAEVVTQSFAASDEQVLMQVRDGESEALSLLFRRYARPVRNIAYRILRNEAEADDLVQEVFLCIFRKAALFNRAHGAARSWIFQVVYHRAFDRRRYLNSRHFYSSRELEDVAMRLADPTEEAPFHETSIEGVLGRQLATRFKERLTPEQQETIQLYFFDGYTLKEIADLTGRSLVNVRSYYYRGLERLRKLVPPEKLK